MYPIGTTCANKGSATALYSAGYDGWGNQTSRTYNGMTATLSYDALNRLVNWQSSSGASEQTVYDASGERVLTRATNLGTTTLTVDAFGLQELFYTGTGTLSSQTGYYTLSGHLIGSTTGTTTTYYLTDAQGSLLTSLSASAITGEQFYAPYGTTRSTVGSLGTAKAFTGQEAEPLTGLYYYHARWYDPVVGLFVSVDTKEGNAQGVNPYGYVRENPETATDPTGEYRCGDPNNCNPGPPPTGGSGGSNPPTNPCVLSGGNPIFCGPQGGSGKPSPGGPGSGTGEAGCHSGCTTQGSTKPKNICDAKCVQNEEQLATGADNQLGEIISQLQWLQFWLGRVMDWVAGFLGTVAGAVLGFLLQGPLGLAGGSVGPYLYALLSDAGRDIGDLITDAQQVQSQFQSEENQAFWAGDAQELYQRLSNIDVTMAKEVGNYAQEFATLEHVGMILVLTGMPLASVGGAIFSNAQEASILNQQIGNIVWDTNLEQMLACPCYPPPQT